MVAEVIVEIKNVLMVDDDDDIREVGGMSLEDVGNWSVSLAGSAEEALAHVSTHTPDLILLDVMMPDVDGPTTLLRLRELPALEQVPIIFMTARVQKDEVDSYLALGAAGVIVKPFDPMTLPNEILDILRKQSSKND